MQKITKRDIILDAMESLMNDTNAQSLSVSDIAKKAGIGKGSIYYYFKSKEDIMEAVIERAYSYAIEKSKQLIETPGLDALSKMEIIYHTCRDSSLELLRQESNHFFALQQSALLHQQFITIMLKNLTSVLSDIIRQGNEEGTMCCKSPEEVAELVLIVLTIKLGRPHPEKEQQTKKTLEVFAYMLENSFHIKKGSLSYLLED